jgi:hypothetical protein
MKITMDSHVDHLTPDCIAWLIKVYENQESENVVVDTLELPPELPALLCDLHGPATKEAPVSETEAYYAKRGNRSGDSRLCKRAPVETRTITVVFGPHEGNTILYTAYPGPVAPREPWDTSLSETEVVASRAFWAEHALSVREG